MIQEQLLGDHSRDQLVPLYIKVAVIWLIESLLRPGGGDVFQQVNVFNVQFTIIDNPGVLQSSNKIAELLRFPDSCDNPR